MFYCNNFTRNDHELNKHVFGNSTFNSITTSPRDQGVKVRHVYHMYYSLFHIAYKITNTMPSKIKYTETYFGLLYAKAYQIILAK